MMKLVPMARELDTARARPIYLSSIIVRSVLTVKAPERGNKGLGNGLRG
jgi:hypothetical protein